MNKIIKILTIISVLIIVGLILGFISLRRFWVQNRETLTVETFEPSSRIMKYELYEGWNLIAFPAKPTTITTASELVEDVAKAGGYVTMVSRWDGDRWQEFGNRGPNSYGFDFPLVLGEAYFVRNEKEISWSINGRVVKNDSTFKLLNPGWNAIGLTPTKIWQAENVLDTINQGVERASEIDFWKSGSWDPFVKRMYSSTNIKTYGDNFVIKDTTGYMVKTNESVSVQW